MRHEHKKVSIMCHCSNLWSCSSLITGKQACVAAHSTDEEMQAFTQQSNQPEFQLLAPG